MNHKGFYIVGGVLVAVGIYLYYTKKEMQSKTNNNQPILGGQSASIPPMEATN